MHITGKDIKYKNVKRILLENIAKPLKIFERTVSFKATITGCINTININNDSEIIFISIINFK